MTTTTTIHNRVTALTNKNKNMEVVAATSFASCSFQPMRFRVFIAHMHSRNGSFLASCRNDTGEYDGSGLTGAARFDELGVKGCQSACAGS